MKYLQLVETDAELSAITEQDSAVVALSEESNKVEYVQANEVDPYNGHEYVDLGLPSGLKWAKMNVGATAETKYGKYFAWGDAEGFTASQVSGKFSSSWYATRPGASVSTDIMPDSGNDAARKNMGGSWRLPTKAEIAELTANTEMSAVTLNSVKGTKFMNKNDNTKYIFMPFAGDVNDGSMENVGTYSFCWASTFDSSSFAWNLSCNNSGSRRISDMFDRYFGFSVRGVCK